MGTPEAAAVSLKGLIDAGHSIAAVYTQPDRPSGRGNRITFSPVKALALEHNLPVKQPLKIRTPEAAAEFAALDAEAAVVVAYGRILPESFLQAYRFGAINVHFSLLPKYRGAAPVNWAIVNGERETGVTTMKMDKGLDTGDIYMQRTTAIDDAETAPDLMVRLSNIGAELLLETLSGLETLKPTPQDDDLATYAPIMNREDGAINWSASAVEIERRIRGFQPFPGSFSFLNGVKCVFWSAETLPFDGNAAPGEVVTAGGDQLHLATGDGLLAVRELQIEGKRRMAVRDVLNGTKIAAGENLMRREIRNCS